jgi:hypothetical protein
MLLVKNTTVVERWREPFSVIPFLPDLRPALSEYATHRGTADQFSHLCSRVQSCARRTKAREQLSRGRCQSKTLMWSDLAQDSLREVTVTKAFVPSTMPAVPNVYEQVSERDDHGSRALLFVDVWHSAGTLAAPQSRITLNHLGTRTSFKRFRNWPIPETRWVQPDAERIGGERSSQHCQQ